MNSLAVLKEVSALLAKMNDANKVSYGYNYPMSVSFQAGQTGVQQAEDLTISGTEIFVFDKIYFYADAPFTILVKDTSTGRTFNNRHTDSRVLSQKPFYEEGAVLSNNASGTPNIIGGIQRGIWVLEQPKILWGSGQLAISVINTSSNANTVLLNFMGVAINNSR